MSDRSRDGGGSTVEALAKVPRSKGPMRALSRVFVHYRVVERAPEAQMPIDYRGTVQRPEGSLASPDVLQKAAALGLRFAGAYAFLGLTGWVPREGWVTEDGDVRVSARRQKGGLIEGAMSSYYLSTTFDDGSVIITWSKSPPAIASSERAESIGGSGDLTADLAKHRAAIERRLVATPDLRPIPALTIDDCVLLSTHHDRFVTTDAQLAGIVNLRIVGWGGLGALLAAMVWSLVRWFVVHQR